MATYGNTKLTRPAETQSLSITTSTISWRGSTTAERYTQLGYQPGSVVRGNLLHGVTRSNYAFGQAANNGIFFDEGSKGILIEDNIIYDISEMPIRFNRSYKKWQTWRNNTFNITPSMPQFNKEISEKAGLEPAYRKKLK